MLYGYARVSTQGQSLEAQIAELKAAGCEAIYSEKISGARSDRKEMHKAIDKLQAGDTFIVTRLDRLARSTRDLLNLIESIGKKAATFKSLRDSWADTTSAHGRLMLTILGGLAEFERELIQSRTKEGRARAIAKGVKMGRKSKLTHYQRIEAKRRIEAGESLREVAKSYNVAHTTIGRAGNGRF